MALEKGLGKKQLLMAVKKVDFGMYLGTEEDKVLLPKRQVPEGLEIGDPVEVFLYKDSQDRLIGVPSTLVVSLVMQLLKTPTLSLLTVALRSTTSVLSPPTLVR